MVSITHERAESQLELKDIIGTTAIGGQGLGYTKSIRWSSASTAQKHEMIQAEIWQEEEKTGKQMLFPWPARARGQNGQQRAESCHGTTFGATNHFG